MAKTGHENEQKRGIIQVIVNNNKRNLQTRKKGQSMSSELRFRKALALVLSLAVVASAGAGLVNPFHATSKLVNVAKADDSIPSYDSIGDAIAAMKADSSIFQAKVGSAQVMANYEDDGSGNYVPNGYIVIAGSLDEAFKVLADTAGNSDVKRVSCSESGAKVSDTRFGAFSELSLSGNVVTAKGMIDIMNNGSSQADSTDAGVADFKSLLQTTLNNGPESITSVAWTYVYESADTNWQPVTKDSGTLTRGENSGEQGGGENKDDDLSVKETKTVGSIADAVSGYKGLSDDKKQVTTLYKVVDNGNEVASLIRMSDNQSALMSSNNGAYVGQPVLMPKSNDTAEVFGLIGSIGTSIDKYLVFMGYSGNNNIASSLVSQAYAETINGNYVLEVVNGNVQALGIPDAYAISEATKTLVAATVAQYNLNTLTLKYINSTRQDDNGFAVDVRQAGNAGEVKAAMTGLNEWTDRPAIITAAQGGNFGIYFEEGRLNVIDTSAGWSCGDVRDSLGSFGGSYSVYVIRDGGETEYKVTDGAFQTSCPAENNGHKASDGSDPNDRHASGDNVPNDSKPQGCDAKVPVGTPDVFQIDRQGSKATIYFTPVRDYTDRYHVVFGNQEGDERYSGIALQVNADQNNGVLAIDVSNLDPAAQYSFKVAPVNGCAVGEWSNWLTAKGVNKYSQAKVKTYRY